MCLCERRQKPQRYSLFNFISFLPRSTNRNMYDSACSCCTLYRRQLVQTTTYLLLFSIFVLQTGSRESTNAQISKPSHPRTPKCVYCICASSSLHSPDWRRLIRVLSVSRHAAVIHLVLPFSLRAPLSCQISCRNPPCTQEMFARVGLKVTMKNFSSECSQDE